MAGENLAQNRLLLQYLSGAGADIAAGNPIGANVNAITQQNIAAQSQAATNQKTMEMLAAMLRGELVPGSSMKMSDKGDFAINLPKSAFGTPGADPGFSTNPIGGSPQPLTSPASNRGIAANPFLQASQI